MSRYDHLASLRAEREQQRFNDAANDAEYYRQEWAQAEQRAEDAAARGDRDSAIFNLDDADDLARRYHEAKAKADQVVLENQIAPQQQYNAELAQAWNAEHADIMNQPHWSGAQDANGNPYNVGQVTNFYERYTTAPKPPHGGPLTQQDVAQGYGMGLQYGSQEHIQKMNEIAEPNGFEPPPSRGEIFEAINANSKYGCSGDEYVNGERQLAYLKSQGNYRDE